MFGEIMIEKVNINARATARGIRKNFYIFISPWLVGFIFLTLGPMLFSLYMSFTKWDMITEIKWIGFQNYINIFSDKDFWQALKVTFYWAAFLPVGIILSLTLASLLNMNIRGKTIFRTIMYIPVIVPAVANCLLWLWMFNYDYGFLNLILRKIGLSPSLWIMHPKTAIPSLILMSLWQTGGNVVIFLAALQGVDKTLMEAAEIDGANTIRRYFNIVIPMISPAIFFQLIMGIIGALQVFNQGYLMTGGGGPLKATLFYVLYIYQTAFEKYQMGYASALSWILFIIIGILTLLVFSTIGKKVYYESK